MDAAVGDGELELTDTERVDLLERMADADTVWIAGDLLGLTPVTAGYGVGYKTVREAIDAWAAGR
jgi:hypothetical protein